MRRLMVAAAAAGMVLAAAAGAQEPEVPEGGIPQVWQSVCEGSSVPETGTVVALRPMPYHMLCTSLWRPSYGLRPWGAIASDTPNVDEDIDAPDPPAAMDGGPTRQKYLVVFNWTQAPIPSRRDDSNMCLPNRPPTPTWQGCPGYWLTASQLYGFSGGPQFAVADDWGKVRPWREGDDFSIQIGPVYAVSTGPGKGGVWRTRVRVWPNATGPCAGKSFPGGCVFPPHDEAPLEAR